MAVGRTSSNVLFDALPDTFLETQLATEDAIKVGVVVMFPEFVFFFILIEVDGHLPDTSFFSTETRIVSGPLILLKLLEHFVTVSFHSVTQSPQIVILL